MQIIEPQLSPTALKIAQKRYLMTDMRGKVIETPGEMFWRVAEHIAKAEVKWGTNGVVKKTAENFYERMVNWKFVCAGKAMFEAGNPGGTGQLSSCFVLPIRDEIGSIFKTLGDAAVIHKNNGGTGFNFSHIRPRGDKVKNIPGAASGPADFLAAYSAALSKILQGAKRQGANIGILNADHPDIQDFITLKDKDGTTKNFNLSVGATDEFMKAVRDDKFWRLINPRTNEAVRKIKARKLFQLIIKHAWTTGDPGLFFLTRANKDNPTPVIGQIEAINPCGEIPLLPYESCNLTSICLENHVTAEKQIDWEDLERSVRLGVRFLDDMIEVNTYPLPEIENMVKNGNRRIGLGVMGFAHLLIKLRIPYNSSLAVELAEKLSKFIREKAENESRRLAAVRGNFPNWDISIYFDRHPMRNAATCMIAPTGTISMLADTTSGIEPIFSLVTKRKTFFEDHKQNRPTEELYMIDPVFEEELQKYAIPASSAIPAPCLPAGRRAGIYKNDQNRFRSVSRRSRNDNDAAGMTKEEILRQVAEKGLSSVKGLPSWFYDVFVTAHDISWQYHVRIQAAWQKYFDNSISKTINFPHTATPADVEKAYLLAWKLDCKGITIYRDGSKKDQVLNLARSKKAEIYPSSIIHYPLPPGSGPSDICPGCGAVIIFENGCSTCHSCGWSKCSL